MYEIHAMPPHQSEERKLTERATKEQAEATAYNLASFGYRNIRLVAREQAPVPQETTDDVPKL